MIRHRRADGLTPSDRAVVRASELAVAAIPLPTKDVLMPTNTRARREAETR